MENPASAAQSAEHRTLLGQQQNALPGASGPSSTAVSIPSLSLPKGGGAIRGIGEKFGTNPATGTSTLSVPIAASAGRSGFGPQLDLNYNSGS